MLKKRTTNKKFYGKWLYKVSLMVPGIAILRAKSLVETIEYIDSNPDVGHYSRHNIYYKAHANQIDIRRVCQLLSELDPESWFKRIEHSTIDIYTNDKDLYNKVCSDSTVINCFEPVNELLENTSQYTIFANKLPHDKFQYKVYLRPHNLAKDRIAKHQFIDWIVAQDDKIRISEKVKEWFIATDWNWDRRYVLVDNEQTLLLLTMRSSPAVGKVYEYKVVDK